MEEKPKPETFQTIGRVLVANLKAASLTSWLLMKKYPRFSSCTACLLTGILLGNTVLSFSAKPQENPSKLPPREANLSTGGSDLRHTSIEGRPNRVHDDPRRTPVEPPSDWELWFEEEQRKMAKAVQEMIDISEDPRNRALR